MARYRALTLSYHGNTLIQPGQEVDIVGEAGRNYEPVNDEAKKAQASNTLASPIASLVTTLRLHAATRGVSPDEVNENDFDEVFKELGDKKPSDAVIKEAAKVLGVKLGSSVA